MLGLAIFGEVYNGYFFWGRPLSEDLWRNLRGLFRKRPDRDPTALGLRENREEGDRGEHYCYEKQRS